MLAPWGFHRPYQIADDGVGKEISRINNKTGGWWEIGVKCGKLTGKTGVLASMTVLLNLDK